jgi:predicted Holliday junction resolvase-like endonuclease
MEIVVSLLLGIIIGSAVTYYVLQKINLRKTVREYETQIQVLKEQHQQALKDARNRSLDGSRAVIKGKIAEQLAPVLPNFKYLPSDARFIGDPIDYVVFNGYTDIKDNGFFRTYTVENSPSSLSVQQCSKVDKYQSNKNSKLCCTSFTSISC